MPRIEPFDEDLDILQKLPDVPNLTQKEMQKEFDKSGNIIKDFLNNIVIPVINSIVAVTGETDKTLTVEDAPADAKAVGNAITNLRNSTTIALNGKLSINGGTLSGGLNMSNSKITGLLSPTQNTDAVNKSYVDGLTKIVRNYEVSAESFVEDDTYTDYPYRASVNAQGITEDWFADVVFPMRDDVTFAPVCQTYAGGVYIWADAVPESNISIPTIVFEKWGAEA